MLKRLEKVPFEVRRLDPDSFKHNYIIRFEDQLLRFRSDTINVVFIAEADKSGTRRQGKLNFKSTNEGYRLCTVPGILTNYCK